MRKTILALLFVLALTGCGYRAPMHPSYLPVVTDSTLYAGIRPGYQQLAALMEKDTGMKPIADHPFLYTISERTSGAILFTGLYNGD